MSSEPFDFLPPEEPATLSPQEIQHRKTAGVDLPEEPIPFREGAGPAWKPAPAPSMFGVPHCPECWSFHHEHEACRR